MSEPDPNEDFINELCVIMVTAMREFEVARGQDIDMVSVMLATATLAGRTAGQVCDRAEMVHQLCARLNLLVKVEALGTLKEWEREKDKPN